jgi:hypothetical protein
MPKTNLLDRSSRLMKPQRKENIKSLPKIKSSPITCGHLSKYLEGGMNLTFLKLPYHQWHLMPNNRPIMQGL